MTMQKRLMLFVAAGGAVAALVYSVFLYHQQVGLAEAEIAETADNLLSRSVQMFMVGTEQYHNALAAAETEEERAEVTDDWNRSITAVDLAVIHDHGADKPRVRLIGDTEVFGIAPLGGAGVAIKNDFERRAAEEIAAGAAAVTETAGGYYRIAVPLPSDAHPGCAECHGVPVADSKVLGTLNAYIPTAGPMGEARNAALTGAGAMVGVIALLAGTIAWFISRKVVRPIHRIAGELGEGATRVDEASKQVAGTSKELADGASEQASSLEETSSALEEMSSMTGGTVDRAREANDLAGQAKEAAEDGTQTMGRLNEAMTGINESSEKISKIIKVIEEIAFQTNLLALNAAVEAARAGEHGKGFAVVAEEVRNLAMRAAEAASETTSLIEAAVTRAADGSQVAEEVGQSLGKIVERATRVSTLIAGITSASEEQAQGVTQLNQAMTQVDQVTQRNASGAEESAAAAQELANQAQALTTSVAALSALVGSRQQS